MIIKKNLFLCCILILTLQGCASSLISAKPIEINEVVSVPNQTKIEIYTKARQWFTNYFISGESVIDYEDKESGTIIGKGVAENGNINYVVPSRINYKIKVDTKDNKMRVSVNLINYTQHTSYDIGYVNSPFTTEKSEKKARATMEKAISSLKEYVLSSKNMSDW